MSETTNQSNQAPEVTRKPVSLEVEVDPKTGDRSPKNDRDRETEIADAPTATPEVVRKPVVIGDAVKDEKDGDRSPKNTG